MTKLDRQIDEQQIARRFAALAPEARRGFIEKLRAAGLNFAELPIVPAERDARSQLSYSQRGLWLTWQLDPDSPAYNMPGALTLEGELNEAALESALCALMARHEVLRTTYPCGDGGEPCQHVLQDVVMPLPAVDLSGLPATSRESTLQQQKTAFASEPFKLDAEPPLRVRLWRLDDRTHVLGLALHHIAGDGASIGILIDELLALYEAACTGKVARLEPMPIQFADHAAWQRNWFEAGERERQLAYWQAKLGAEHPPTLLPLDRPRGGSRQMPSVESREVHLDGHESHEAHEAHADGNEGKLAFEWPEDLSEALRRMAREHGASVFIAVLALLKLTLYRISGEAEQRIGSPIANRQRPETASLIGYLTNVQVLRTRIDPSRDFSALLAAVRDTVLDAQMHPDLPFDMLVEALQPVREPGVHPLFQVKCTQQDGLPAPRQVAGLTVSVQALSGGRAHFDLSLDFVDKTEGLAFEIAYDRELFDQVTVERIAQSFTHLSRQVVTQPEAGVTEWPLPWPPAELRGPDSPFAHDDVDVLAMWHAVCRAKPDAACVSDEGCTLSHAQVDAQSSWLAARLIEQGIGTDDRVAILAERSCEFVLGVLAVLKAGAAYVPLDPRLPTSRLHHQVADSGARVLLVADAWSQAPAGLTVLSMACPAQLTPELARTSARAHPGQAAYIIYTSGSTGTPKGVVVSRGALANYVQAMLARLALPDEAAAMAMISTVGADLGHTTFFGALCSGRTLHLIGAECAFDPDRFAAYMAQHRIDVLKIVPSHLQALMHAARPADVLPRCALILGGEATSWPLLERIRALRPDCRVFNHYGPTETTVGALMQDAATADAQAPLLPLGTPLANTQALVLGPDLQRLPRGMAGELYLGGAGVARGYQDRPGQTAERFIAHPFVPGARLYRTGDRVRQCADGSLVFLGRVDDQVKVRGHRVELQEITQVLRAQLGVREAEVIARDDSEGRKRLLAYVVLDRLHADASDLDSKQGEALIHLREALSATLPDHMVPTAIVPMHALPLTPNGKVDRKALPEPPLEAVAAQAREQDAPCNATERILADIWAQVLKLPQVGRHDNFFELGGDSILTLQIVARARKQGLKVSPRQLMSLQTVAALAETSAEPAPSAVQPSTLPSVQPGTDEFFDLTPVQRWFFEQHFDEPHHWNQSVLLDACMDLSPEQVSEAVTQVIARHEALRLCFEEQGGAWRQRVKPMSDMGETLRCVKLAGMVSGRAHPEREALDLAAHAVIEDAQRCLSLSRPFKAIWLDGGAARPGQLLLVAHHLVVDAVSWRILIEDLQTACLKEPDEGATPLTSSLRTWSQALVRQAREGRFRDELPHWQAQLASDDDGLPGRPHERNLVADARTIDAALNTEATANLLSQAPTAYRTQVNDLLLTALARTLCAWSDKESVLIELEGHGRETDAHDDIDLSRTVGWFTTLFPVRLRPGQGDVGEGIRAVKEQLRQVPNKGLGHGVLRHLDEQGRVLAEGARPQVTFNYLGQVDGQASTQDTVWRLSETQPQEQRSPGSTRRTWIDIGAMVRDGRLQVRWTYSERIHDAATVGRLADAFINELHSLISHCAEEANHGLTPSDVPLAGLTQAQLDVLSLPQADVKRLADLYPLSPMQAGMLFHNAFDPEGTSYTNQVRIDIDGLDAHRFATAWQALMDRHEVLRTGFIHAAGKPLQWVARAVPVPLMLHDERAHPDQQQALDALARQDLARGFDLAKPPLMRLTLVRVGERRHHLIWTRHHLLMDGWSTSLLMSEMLACYRGEPLPPRQGRFRDHIALLQTRDRDIAIRHWQALLGGLRAPTLLAGALPQPEPSSAHLSLARSIDAAATAGLQAFARQARVTINTLVQAAWSLLLQRYTGQQAVSFGATTSGRPAELPGAERMLGLFINTLPVMAQPSPGQDKVAWLQALQAQNAASREHEQLSLAEIQRCAQVEGGTLFDSIVVFENYPVDEALRTSQQQADQGPSFHVRQIREETNYPMTLSVTLGQTLSIEYAWAGDCFSREQVERMAGHVEALLQGLADPACQRLGELGMLSASESSALARLGNGMENCANDAGRTPVHRQIAQQAAQRPNAIALICGHRSCTHAELEARANQLAHHLIRHGVHPEDRVGVAVERGLDMIVSVLAILKAGAAYVPLDPAYPQDRLAFMIEDSGMKLVLAHATTEANMPRQTGVVVTTLDRLTLEGEPAHDPDVAVNENSLAYVIYTSGSTGRPKGVGVSHQALARHAQVGVDLFGLGAEDRMLQFATLNFDGFIEQVFPPLSVGAAVVVRGPDLWDSRTLRQQLIEHRITVADLTTAYWLLLAQDFARESAREGPLDAGPLKQVNVGGEAMPPEGLKAWRDAGLAHVKLLNTYGPTEATVTASALDCTPFVEGTKGLPQQMPIGHALGGRVLRVLDADLNPVPMGVVGELAIGGGLLARGYEGRPALTAERFIADPFDAQGGRLYRTGDLVRWNEAGELTFLGRVDHQVKIRGLRIEPGEIEARLLAQPEVREAVVMAGPSPAGTRLIAHVSLHAGHAAETDGERLRERLAGELPDYMVPSLVMLHAALPLNPNGKVDRKALPNADLSSQSDAASGRPDDAQALPQDETEQALAALWQEVLGVRRVGRHEHFFALGGHSLLALQLSSLIQQQWPGAMTVRDIFARPVLSDMATTLRQSSQAQASSAQSLMDIDAFIDQLESA